MELTNDSELRVKMDDKHNCRFFFGVDRGNGFDATVKFEHHQGLTEDPKPNPITSSLDGVGETIGLSLKIGNVRVLNYSLDLLFNEWKTKCQKS